MVGSCELTEPLSCKQGQCEAEVCTYPSVVDAGDFSQVGGVTRGGALSVRTAVTVVVAVLVTVTVDGPLVSGHR